MTEELKDASLHYKIIDIEIERMNQGVVIAKLDSRVRKLENGIRKAIGILLNSPEISINSYNVEEVMDLDTCLAEVLAVLESTS